MKKLLYVIMMLGLISCSKDIPIVGPQGAPGNDGIVNIKSFIFDLSYTQINVTGWYAYYQVDVPGLTPEIEQDGMVQVYRNRNGWQALPFETPIFTEGEQVTESCITTYHFKDGKLSLDFYPSFYCEKASYFPDGKYKVVMITAVM